MPYEEVFAAAGGLNFDDDPRAFHTGDTDYRLNMVPTELGATYVLTNMKGTTQKQYSFTHSSQYDGAAYATIGACYDVKRDAVYFFIHSSLNNHCIMRYNIQEETFDKIAWENTNLGFDLDKPIFDAFVLDNWLFFNPRSSSPRSINVEWAYWDYVCKSTATAVGDYVKDFYGRVWKCIDDTGTLTPPYEHPEKFEFVSLTYGDVYNTDHGSAGTLIRERYFYNVSRVIPDSLSVNIVSDTSFKFNYLRGKTFQFTHRFYVEDQGFSRAAPFTESIGFFQDERWNGELPGDVTRDNLIRLGIDLRSFGFADDDLTWNYNFKFVEILVRNQETDEWASVDRIPLQRVIELKSGFTMYYDFYNDGSYDVVDSTDIEVPFDYLPIRANSQCLLDGERIAYGGVTEGYDGVTPDVTLMEEHVAVGSVPEEPTGAAAETITFTETPFVVVAGGVVTKRYKYTTSSFDKDDTDDGDTWVYTIDGATYSAVFTSAETGSEESFQVALYYLLNSDKSLKWNLDPSLGVSVDELESNYGPKQRTLTLKRYAPANMTDAGRMNKFLSLKSGALHEFCLYYYDDVLRRSEPIPLPSQYIKTLPEMTETTGTGYRRWVDYEIDHAAPSWASYWRFGYAGNSSVSDFWQYNIKEAGIVTNSASDYYNMSFFDISPLQLYDSGGSGFNWLFPGANIEKYQFVKGDRVRVLTDKSSVNNEASLTHDDWSSVTHDYEIAAYDPETHYIYFHSDGVISNQDSGDEIDYSDPSVIIEIYRKKGEKGDIIFREVGELNVCDNGSHENSVGTIPAGDVYVISRTLSVKPGVSWGYSGRAPIFVESYSWSDFYDSFNRGWGKSGLKADIGQRSLNIIRYSNKFSKNTLASSISTYDGLDYKPVSYRYGAISAITQIGGMLKVVFENNVASINVNKTELYDVGGQSQVVKSDEILGSINYSEEGWGTTNPESVLVVDRNIYFFDLKRKAYCRNAPNGTFPISEHKMAKYFIDKCDAITTSGAENVTVRSGWEDDQGLLYVSFLDLTDQSNNECVMFHEKSSRWIGFTDVSLSYDINNYVPLENDSSLWGSAPDFSLSNTVTGVQTLNITALADGIFINPTYTLFFNNAVTFVRKGFTVSLEAYLDAASSTNVNPLIRLNYELAPVTTGPSIPGPGAGTAMSSYIGSGDKLTYQVTATEDSLLYLEVGMLGSQQVYTDDTGILILNVNVSGVGVPVFVTTGSHLIGFTDNDLNLYNTNETRCNFFGTQYNYSTRLYGAANSSQVKRYDTMHVHANKAWDVTDIRIAPSVNYPNGMQSEIPASYFEEEEGVFRSEYLCNMLSSSAVPSVVDLLNGDYLRGYIISHDMEGSETDEHTLFKVDIGSEISK